MRRTLIWIHGWQGCLVQIALLQEQLNGMLNEKSVALGSRGQLVTPRVRLSTHSTRKTRGYAMHAAGVSIEQICKVLNHSHPKITMRYIGLDDTAIQQSYRDFVL